MKKITLIFLSFFVFAIFSQIVKADILPYYSHSLRRYGIGFTSVVSPLVMYQTPSEEGKILETLNFDYKGNATCSINPEKCSIDDNSYFHSFTTASILSFSSGLPMVILSVPSQPFTRERSRTITCLFINAS